MQCPVCGKEVSVDDASCPNCGASLERVQILSSEERENFQGVTIETETSGSKTNSDADSEFHRQNNGGNNGSYWGGRGQAPFPRVWVLNSVLAGLIGFLFLAIIILFLSVFALPIGIFFLVILLVTWLLRRFRF